MKRQVITSDAPKATGPFSQAVVAAGIVYTSGQICLTPEGKLLDGSIEEQTHQVMHNLEAILKSAGTSLTNVVKTTIYVSDMSLYGAVNETYNSYMREPFPARETVCVKELPLGARVEISMIAIEGETL